MNKQWIVFFLISIYGLSAEATGHRWQCSSTDKQGKSWSYSSSYRKMALNKALYACKKKSKDPASCSASMNQCDVIAINQNSNKSIWQCTALDFNGKAFTGHIAYHRDRAAISALADCKEQSKEPDSCYIHLIGCQDLTKENH